MISLALNRPGKPELSDVLVQAKPVLTIGQPLHPIQHKALEDLIRCRTPQLGGHIHRCDHCGHQKQAYNSCRNRHCPKCQLLRQHQWADSVQGRLLPTPYFHLVFTLPHQLNPLIYLNQQLLYDLLFRSAWKSLQQAALNPRFLGAQPGAMAILHTWGATLSYHPHIHMLVPAGGLSQDGMEWIASPRSFFVPREALRGMFRGIFMRGLARLWAEGILRIPEGTPPYDTLKRQLYDKSWNVHLEKVRGGVQSVVAYLSRYTHRVAISNQRILSVSAGQVIFAYKDHRDGQRKRMSLDAMEFSRRFLQHILPLGFTRVRYYGLLAPVCAGDLQQALALIGKARPWPRLAGLNTLEVLRELIGTDPLLCPVCQKGRMLRFSVIQSSA
jgi:hypothetical protein